MPTTTDGSGGTTIVLGSGQNGSGGSDWIDYARLALGAYQALKKPSFSQQPLSPEQKQIYQIYLNNLMNPTYQKLGPDLVARMQAQTDKLGQGSWTSPKTFGGDVGYAGTGGLPKGGNSFMPWSTPGQNTTYPGQNLPTFKDGGSSGAAVRNPETGRATPNIQQWEPASGFPLSPSSPETDPNREVSLDRANHPLANINPSGANGSIFQTGADQGTPRQNPDGSYTKGGTPSGMSYNPGELPNFITFLRSQGVKDAAKVAIGFFGGGLVGAELAAAKIWWDHYQSSKPKGGG